MFSSLISPSQHCDLIECVKMLVQSYIINKKKKMKEDASSSSSSYLGKVPKHHFWGKFYLKCIVNITYTIIYRVKFFSKRRFGTYPWMARNQESRGEETELRKTKWFLFKFFIKRVFVERNKFLWMAAICNF